MMRSDFKITILVFHVFQGAFICYDAEFVVGGVVEN